MGVLLRVMLLQHLYGLSDPQAEEQLKDRLSFQKFVQLDAHEAVVASSKGKGPRKLDAQREERTNEKPKLPRIRRRPLRVRCLRPPLLQRKFKNYLFCRHLVKRLNELNEQDPLGKRVEA